MNILNTMQHLFKNRRTLAAGFTILETLVAIAIILVAVIATLGAAQLGLQSSLYARDQITAYYLAEEAIEQVRNDRDTNEENSCSNFITGGGTNCQPIPVCSTDNSCGVDVVTNSTGVGVFQCSGSGACGQLYQDNTTHLYSENPAGVKSLFVRTVKISYPYGSANEAFVTVKVTWSSTKSSNQSIILYDDLFNYQ